MQHQTDIRPVDPHTEGHGGHQHRVLSFKEMLKSPMPDLRLKTGVIRNGLNPVVAEPLSPALHRNSCAGVNQTGAPGILQGINDILQRISNPPAHGVVQIVTLG